MRSEHTRVVFSFSTPEDALLFVDANRFRFRRSGITEPYQADYVDLRRFDRRTYVLDEDGSRPHETSLRHLVDYRQSSGLAPQKDTE